MSAWKGRQLGNKPRKKAIGKQTADKATVSILPPKIAKAPRPTAAGLRFDEEQYPAGECAPAVLGEAELPGGLAVTYSFDTVELGTPYAVAVRFVGDTRRSQRPAGFT
ncbi:hypothetical protein SAMN05216266_12047 [Amycolatopsis marina]|uniref:Uncharacterized protein n=1 Tax=Amycolatopsis marina TaxID=490629 RepID=A0A1I1C2C2_9PSEU|nr:hypothetical protein [Amycolatopsis marina]SFB56759.1 hypothetical protein SAMN05216266_12047 [Amycolatopsis marina]